MTEVTSITKIIQKKVKCFIKEQFIDLFENILNDYVNDFPNTTNTTQKLNIKLKNNNIHYIWHTISKHAFNTNNKYKESSLIIKYLSLKVNLTMQRLLYISSRYNRSIYFVSKKYMDICRYEIHKINLQKRFQFSLQNNLPYTKIPNNKKELFPGKIHSKLKSSKKVNFALNNTEENNIFNRTQYELEGIKKEEDSNLNLFIGNFNIQRFKDKNQSVYLKKYDNIATFIFVDKEDANNPNIKNNPQNRAIVSKKGGKVQIVSMPKIYGKKGSVNIHRFDSFKFIDNNEVNEIEHENKHVKVKHHNVLTTYMNNNGFSKKRNSSAWLKKLAIKVDYVPGNLSERSEGNLQSKKWGRNYNENNSLYGFTEGSVNKNGINLSVEKRINNGESYCKSVLTNNMGKNKKEGRKEKSMVLGHTYENIGSLKKMNKKKSKIKLVNFFEKTDLYY